MPDYHFSAVQAQDRGRGYFAVDMVSWIAYAWVIFTGISICVMAVRMQSFMLLLGSCLQVPAAALSIYVARLLIRAILVWRDVQAERGRDARRPA
jgi:hypothetical protein